MDTQRQPRIGIPYRSAGEERDAERGHTELRPYVEAVEEAGGEAVILSLFLSSQERAKVAETLEGILLPGSSADVDPARYHQVRGPKTALADQRVEETDGALLEHAFQTAKPVLAICYGMQFLNTFRGGTLVQDIETELPAALRHRWNRGGGEAEPHHAARLEAGSILARLAGTPEAVVNSSHHQSVRESALGLRVTARAPDGVVEGLELDDPGHWVVGAQWHPERQRRRGDPGGEPGAELARALFRELVRAARARVRQPAPEMRMR
ncbi:MAG TPA: gamma-glutamyl-gamma-aminobutyrate hydrolase family protein [Candidatus Acidoferrales bacterium]|nr:gamma-glutamyl-gamma-aminobutyrate hydrolase family protein [Candidatus Acidoferrales bacterium]